MTDEVQIIPVADGPLKVTGPVELIDPHGNRIPTQKGTVYLCRCGGSTNKPFCDGTHSKIGFDGAMAAVRGAESG